MKYMGSKNRIAKHILPIILKDRKEGQFIVDAFAGGMNLIDKVAGNRIANDIHYELIAMFRALVYENWTPPKFVNEQYYNDVKIAPDAFEPEEVAYIGFNSYGGKFFRGYRRDNSGNRDYWREHYSNIMKQIPNLDGVIFMNESYNNLEIPSNSIIYCDPPYLGTESYSENIDYCVFWDWCRKMKSDGHSVFVSEYNAPEDFTCVWKKEVNSSLSNGNAKNKLKAVEKLFTLK